MAQKSSSRGLDKVIVRLPDGMRDRLKAAAEKNNRSMNAEIIQLVEDGFVQRDYVEWLEEQHRSLDDPTMQAEIEQQQKEWAREQEQQRSINDISDQLHDLKQQIDHLTKGMVVYGRAFEMSVLDNQDRANDILDRAIAEVEAKAEYKPKKTAAKS